MIGFGDCLNVGTEEERKVNSDFLVSDANNNIAIDRYENLKAKVYAISR